MFTAIQIDELLFGHCHGCLVTDLTGRHFTMHCHLLGDTYDCRGLIKVLQNTYAMLCMLGCACKLKLQLPHPGNTHSRKAEVKLFASCACNV